MPGHLIVGTRGSPLARRQTEWVMDRIAAANPGLDVRMQIISTAGDRQRGPLPEIGGKGLFTEDLERALLDGAIDVAVHSCKDLPTTLADGLAILALPPREDPRDAWISADGRGLNELPNASVVGTSSLRRQAQLLRQRGDLVFIELRGNVDTRIRKVQEGECTATVLAMAGLIRSGCMAQAIRPFEPEVMLPAAGQGALVVEGCNDDQRVRAIVRPLHDQPTALAVECERAVLAGLNAGCRAPVGVLAVVSGDNLQCDALVCDPLGRRTAEAHARRPVSESADVAREIIEQLLASAAADIIAACR